MISLKWLYVIKNNSDICFVDIGIWETVPSKVYLNVCIIRLFKPLRARLYALRLVYINWKSKEYKAISESTFP
jgi:hypothetical protein